MPSWMGENSRRIGSTVLDVSGDAPRIIRQGYFPGGISSFLRRSKLQFEAVIVRTAPWEEC